MRPRDPEGPPERRRIGLLQTALVLWVVLLAALTLTPQPTSARDPGLHTRSLCIICGERGTSDAALNVAFFVPLGLLLGALLSGRRRVTSAAVTAAAALSVTVELTQQLIPGRYSTLGDVVWNTTGGCLGVLLWSQGERFANIARHPSARWRASFAGLVFLATLAFGVLMEPAWPHERYWGQWTPDLGSFEKYRGKVVSARLDTLPIPAGRFPDARDPRSLLAAQEWSIRVTVVKGPPTTSFAPILSIYDARRRGVLLLGAVGEDLVYRERDRAFALRLDEPDLRVPGALAQTMVGDTMELSLIRSGSARCLKVDGSGACLDLTPGRAWALLASLDESTSWLRASVDVLWMFLLLLPVGYWSGRWRDLVTSGALVAVLLGLTVELTRMGPPTVDETMGSALGLLAGYACRLLADRRIWHQSLPGL